MASASLRPAARNRGSIESGMPLIRSPGAERAQPVFVSSPASEKPPERASATSLPFTFHVSQQRQRRHRGDAGLIPPASSQRDAATAPQPDGAYPSADGHAHFHLRCVPARPGSQPPRSPAPGFRPGASSAMFSITSAKSTQTGGPGRQDRTASLGWHLIRQSGRRRPMASQLNPYLNFNGDARQAPEFYPSVFGRNLNLNTPSDFRPKHSPPPAQTTPRP